MTVPDSRRLAWHHWYPALIVSWVMAVAPAPASAAGDDPPKPAITVPCVVQATLPVKECRLVVATDPPAIAPVTLAGVIERSPTGFWVFVAVAALLGYALFDALNQVRAKKLETDLAKLALRETGATAAGSMTLLRAHCHTILGLQGAKLQGDQAAQDLVKACGDFLKSSA